MTGLSGGAPPADAGEGSFVAVARHRPGKARFDHVYNQRDPRAYFQTLRPVQYQTPAHGQRVFRALTARLREETGRDSLVVLDLCCSYGINAALLNHDLTLEALYRRYCSEEVSALTTEELVAADRAFYDLHRRPAPARVLGMDTAFNAVAYAGRVGVLEAGSSENLEEVEPGELLGSYMPAVDMITVTGGVGYIGERTFERLLALTPGRAPWIAAFCLRWFDYRTVAAVAHAHDLMTEKLADVTFPQRRFADEAERRYVVDELQGTGIDPTGKESEGFYHAEFYLSRPASDVARTPLTELLAPEVV